MMKRKMMLEIDHMSVKAAGRALDIFESRVLPRRALLAQLDGPQLDRAGLLASAASSPSTCTAPRRSARRPKRTDALRDKYDVGYGYGTDMNGVGGWPGPRGADAPNPVTYPFKQRRRRLRHRQADHRRAHLGPQHRRRRRTTAWSRTGSRTSGSSAARTWWTTSSGAPSPTSTPGAPPSSTRPAVNLAKGASASASSSESNPFTSYAPGRAVDGDDGHPLGQRLERRPVAASRPRLHRTWSSASPSTGSARTGSRTASSSPPTARTGRPPGPPPPATAAWTRPGSPAPRPATSGSTAWTAARIGATRCTRWASHSA